MAVPGIGGVGHAMPTVSITASSNTPVDLAADLGSPSGAIVYKLIVESGVTQGSNSTSTPAIDATGLHADSEGFWYVYGEIKGMGGTGGTGSAATTFTVHSGGGGGGGAGAAVGPGGTGISPGTNGSDGTATTGGAGGTTSATGGGPSVAIDGSDGGDAVLLNHTVTAVVNGGVRGGGGGGAPGGFFGGLVDGAAGGDLDQDGVDNATSGSPGVKGYAVRYSGGSASWTASGGGTVGTVG